MHIRISPETEKLIHRQIQRGQYDSSSALANEAIQILVHRRLSGYGSTTQALPEALIGIFDSSQEKYGENRRDLVAELVADHLQNQGISVPPPWQTLRATLLRCTPAL